MGRRSKTRTEVQAYLVFYDFNLWSNFTYHLDDPEGWRRVRSVRRAHDHRAGCESGPGISRWRSHADPQQLRPGPSSTTSSRTSGSRRALVGSTPRSSEDDEVRVQRARGCGGVARAQLTEWLRVLGGLRGDFYWFDVEAISLPENSGQRVRRYLRAPRWVVVSGAVGFDRDLPQLRSRPSTATTRGARPSPSTPRAASQQTRVDPLVKSEGAEIGMRTTWIPGLAVNVGALVARARLRAALRRGRWEHRSPAGPAVATASSSRTSGARSTWLAIDADVTLHRVRVHRHGSGRGRNPRGDLAHGGGGRRRGSSPSGPSGASVSATSVLARSSRTDSVESDRDDLGQSPGRVGVSPSCSAASST